jgi:ankyrin repeat protein
MAVFAHGVAGRQHPSGAWLSSSHRPPIEDSPVTLTALCLRVLELCPMPAGRMRDVEQRRERAHRWLAAVPPLSIEERAFQLLGLSWSGSSEEELAPFRDALLDLQHDDGGWAQIASRSSDAYATGLALVALHEAAAFAPTSETYRKGVAFLLKQQQPDGSWHVETRRRLPGLPHFETGFPHGEDQFLSYAASGWATMALLLADSPARSRVFWPTPVAAPALEAIELAAIGDGVTPLIRAALFGSVDDLTARLEAGDDPNVASASGLTPLMASVHDPARVRLLLEAGAEVEALSTEKATALLLACAYEGALASVELLLEAGATLERSAIPPILAAALQGDTRVIDCLIGHGASLSGKPMDFTPLQVAIAAGDLELTSHLLEKGAPIKHATGGGGASALHDAVLNGNTDLVRLLVATDAEIETRSAGGYTPLLAAALIDPGDRRIVQILLDAGASVDAKLEDGTDVLALAQRNHHPATEILRTALEAKRRGKDR